MNLLSADRREVFVHHSIQVYTAKRIGREESQKPLNLDDLDGFAQSSFLLRHCWCSALTNYRILAHHRGGGGRNRRSIVVPPLEKVDFLPHLLHYELLELVAKKSGEHGLKTLQFGQPEQLPLEMVVQSRTGLEVHTQPDWNLCVCVKKAIF